MSLHYLLVLLILLLSQPIGFIQHSYGWLHNILGSNNQWSIPVYSLSVNWSLKGVCESKRNVLGIINNNCDWNDSHNNWYDIWPIIYWTSITCCYFYSLKISLIILSILQLQCSLGFVEYFCRECLMHMNTI